MINVQIYLKSGKVINVLVEKMSLTRNGVSDITGMRWDNPEESSTDQLQWVRWESVDAILAHEIKRPA